MAHKDETVPGTLAAMKPDKSDRIAEVMKLHYDGLNSTQISRELGIVTSQVIAIIERSGETPNYDDAYFNIKKYANSEEAWNRRFAKMSEDLATVAEQSLAKSMEILLEDNVLEFDSQSDRTARLKAVKDLMVAAGIATDKSLVMNGKVTTRSQVSLETTGYTDGDEILGRLAVMGQLRQQAKAIEGTIVDAEVIDDSE